MNDSLQEELFVEPKGPFGLKLVAAISALALTIALLLGYTYLRQRHVAGGGTPSLAAQTDVPEIKTSPKAVVLVDEALLQGNKTIVGGTVRNTASETLEQVTVELELKRRKDGTMEKKLVSVMPSLLEPGQDGRYSLELKAPEYSSARLVGLRTGPDSSSVAYTSGPGQKRPLERLPSRTTIVNRPASKRGEFLNSPDNPARVP